MRDKFGNTFPLEWSMKAVETFVAVRPVGTAVSIFNLEGTGAMTGRMAVRDNGELYGVYLDEGDFLFLVPPTDHPDRIDVKIVITGPRPFSKWVEWDLLQLG